ncbi:MAG TPA: EAL domain-containing protein [Gammaproteobacteria bacterium]|nr:EAL domain-containing protein [Gammaproteobacteria bacterium]
MIYIVDDDIDQGKRLALQLASYGFRTASFIELDELREATRTLPPAAIVSGILFPEDDKADIETIATLHHIEGEPIPIVFISRRSDANARLLALRAGGSGYFTKPIALASLAVKLHELADQSVQPPYRIMLIDDDETTNMVHAAMLKKANCKVLAITNPLDIIKESLAYNPEMIFLDIYMPEVNGLEIAKILQQEDTLQDVPIVFLSGEEDEKIKALAIKEGAAAFINKPILASSLVNIATSRAAQYRARSVKKNYFGHIKPVTGLFTQNQLMADLKQYCNHEKKHRGLVAILVLEIDNYEYLYQTIGEDQSHLLRARLAHLIRSCLDEQDTPASYTNSSFLVLTSQADLNDLERLASKLHRAITMDPLDIMGKNLRVGISIGVSQVTDNDHNQTLSEASLACSQARNEGGIRVHLQRSMPEQMIEKEKTNELKQQVKGAIRKRRMFLVFSPAMGLVVESTERYTVLIRLKDDKDKVMYPAQFIAIINEYNLMPEMDRWIVQTALQILSKKQKTNPNTEFFVKLSMATILNPEFTSWLQEVLNTFEIKPNTCVFEIQENILIGNLDKAQNLVRQLSHINCKLSISEIRGSEAALGVINLLQPNYLRLHSSLLSDIAQDKEKQAHLKQICKTVHNKEHKIQVLAAYIEDLPSLSLLWNIGVDYIQANCLEQSDILDN